MCWPVGRCPNIMKLTPLTPRASAPRWHALADDRSVHGGDDFDFLEKIGDDEVEAVRPTSAASATQ
jgi:hypothetical protein